MSTTITSAATSPLSGDIFTVFNWTNAQNITLRSIKRDLSDDLPRLVIINGSWGPMSFHFSMLPDQARLAARKILHLANVAEQYEIEAISAAERAQEVAA